MSELPESWVREYLRGVGMPDEIITWKYYDADFNRIRERGYAWVRGDRIRGFVGLIPFDLEEEGLSRPAVWFCDWAVTDPEHNPGVGVRLLLKAIEEAGLVFGIAGTADTRSLLPRMAQRTIEGACVVHELRLRSAGLRVWLAAARRRRERGRAGRSADAEISPGVSTRIGALLESKGNGGDPICDLRYIRWQIERCPSLESLSVVTPERGAPQAAALCWRSAQDSGDWRMALWSSGVDATALEDVVRESIRHLDERGAARISVAISHRDREAGALLGAQGFHVAARWPLYLCTRARQAIPGEPAHLSFLANDLAYRFF